MLILKKLILNNFNFYQTRLVKLYLTLKKIIRILWNFQNLKK